MGWRPGQWWGWTSITTVCKNYIIDKGSRGTCFYNWNSVSNQEGTHNWTQHSINNDNWYWSTKGGSNECIINKWIQDLTWPSTSIIIQITSLE